ncbi:hypothetical protein PG988_011229 [Apiospora saccharicola]
MATVTVKEKDGVISESLPSGLGDNELRHLDASLEEFSQQKKAAGRRKRPFFMLIAVILLFLVSGGGVALSVLLFINPVEAEYVNLARILVLVASGVSLLYTAIHVRGAFSNYVNDAPHIPPHFRGEYVHASALIVARLGIPTWVAAAVATALLISKSEHPLGIFGKQIPYPLLFLIACVVALISFIALAATINRNPTPFALAGISSSSLMRRDGVFFEDDDDEEAFLSISRRASMQRAADEKGEKRMTPPLAPSPPPALARPKSTSTSKGSSRRATLTEEALNKAAHHGRRVARPNNLDVAKVQAAEDDAKTELMANSPVRPNYYTTMPSVQRSSVPPVPPLPPKLLKGKTSKSKLRHTLAPPSRGGAGGGGWHDDWNSLADQAGVRSRTRSNSTSGDGQRTYTMSNYTASSTMTSHSSTAPMLSTRQLQQQHQQYQQQQQQQQQQRPGTSHSQYSTAKTDTQPLPIRVAEFHHQHCQQQQQRFVEEWQHDFAHPEADRGPEGRRPAARNRGPSPAPATAPPSKPPRRKLQRKPSNFSRPITPSDALGTNGRPKTAVEFV